MGHPSFSVQHRIDIIERGLEEALRSLSEGSLYSTIPSWTLSTDRFNTWSPSYHLYRCQYRALSNMLRGARPDAVLPMLEEVLRLESIPYEYLYSGYKGYMRLHPTVMSYLRGLLSEA